MMPVRERLSAAKPVRAERPTMKHASVTGAPRSGGGARQERGEVQGRGRVEDAGAVIPAACDCLKPCEPSSCRSARVAAAARGARLGLVLVCPPVTTVRCSGTFTVRSGSHRLARGAFKLPPGGGTQTLSPVAAALLAKLRRVHHMSVRLTIAAYDGARLPTV